MDFESEFRKIITSRAGVKATCSEVASLIKRCGWAEYAYFGIRRDQLGRPEVQYSSLPCDLVEAYYTTFAEHGSWMQQAFMRGAPFVTASDVPVDRMFGDRLFSLGKWGITDAVVIQQSIGSRYFVAGFFRKGGTYTDMERQMLLVLCRSGCAELVRVLRDRLADHVLTEREKAVFKSMQDHPGSNRKRVASDCGMTVSTVNTHVSSIRKKFIEAGFPVDKIGG